MREIKICVKGLNIDPLVTKLSKNIKTIKNIERKNYDELNFSVDKKDFHNIKKYLKYYDYTVFDKWNNIKKKYIASFLISIIVLPIIFLFAIYSSNILWSIKIEGEKIDQQEIMDMLNSNNIKVGKKIKLSGKDIEKVLLSNDKIAQASCVYIGTTLMINISPKLVYNPTSFEPIRASFSGVVEQISNVRGELNCRVGDFVKKGDVLILPYITDKFGNNISVEPKGEILGKVYSSATITLPREEKILTKSGKTKTYTKICWNKNRDISYKPFVFFETKVYNSYISSVLPIVRQKVVYFELVESVKENDLVAEQENCEQQSKILVEESLPDNTKIVDEKTYSVVANDTLFSTTTISFWGSII